MSNPTESTAQSDLDREAQLLRWWSGWREGVAGWDADAPAFTSEWREGYEAGRKAAADARRWAEVRFGVAREEKP